MDLQTGKGVIICDKKEQESIDEMLDGKFGPVLVTIRLASFIAMCDGKSHMQLATSQDHGCA